MSAGRGRPFLLTMCLHVLLRAGCDSSPINRPLAVPRRDAMLMRRASLPALLPVPFEELIEQTLLLVWIVRGCARRLGAQLLCIDNARDRCRDLVEPVLQPLVPAHTRERV